MTMIAWLDRNSGHKASASLLVVAAVSALSVLACSSIAFSAARIGDFLPLGELHAAPQDGPTQTQLIDALSRAVAAGEQQRAQADARFLLVRSVSADSCDRRTAAIRRLLGPDKPFVSVPKELVLGPTTYSTRWTYSGVKLRHESRVVGDREPLVPLHYANHTDAVFDGERTFCYYPKDGRGTIGSGQAGGILTKAPEPRLTLLRIDGDTLSGLLRSATVKYEGRQTVGDTECLKISASIGALRYEIWISSTNGYCAKRILSRRSETNVFVLAEVRTFQQAVDGTWFPLSGSYAEFRPVEPEGEAVCLSSTDWSVTSYSPEVPADAFALQFPEGTKVDMYGGAAPLTSFTIGK